MPVIITALVVVALLAVLAVRALRSDDPDRWARALAELFFAALATWLLAGAIAHFGLLRGGLGELLYPLYDLAGPASVVAKAAFAAMAFLLMLRGYRRLRR